MTSSENYRKEFMKNILLGEGHTMYFMNYKEGGKACRKAKRIYRTHKDELSDLLPRLNRLEEVLGINQISDEGGKL